MADASLKPKTPIDACQELVELVTRHTNGKGNGIHATAIAQLEFMHESVVPTALCAVYEPTLCITLQGKKETLLGKETYHYGAAQYIVVTVDLPLSGNTVEATPDKPYLCFKLNLDATQLWDIITQIQCSPDKKENSVRGLFISDANAPLIDCAAVSAGTISRRHPHRSITKSRPRKDTAVKVIGLKCFGPDISR